MSAVVLTFNDGSADGEAVFRVEIPRLSHSLWNLKDGGPPASSAAAGSVRGDRQDHKEDHREGNRTGR